MDDTSKKTVLFFVISLPGHVNPALGIADRLKNEHDIRTVFMLLGPSIGDSIQEHGHELVIIEETTIYEDYDLSDCGEQSNPGANKCRQRTKRQFHGGLKWLQIALRFQQQYNDMDPLESFCSSVHMFEELMIEEIIENHEKFEQAIKSIKPDMLVVNQNYIPPCVLNLKGIPWIRLFPGNPLGIVKSKLPNDTRPAATLGTRLFDKCYRENLRKEKPVEWKTMLDMWNANNDSIEKSLSQADVEMNRFLLKHGCEPLKRGLLSQVSPFLNLYMYPEVLDYDQDDDIFYYDAKFFRCDSLIRDPPEPKTRQLWINKLREAMKGKEKMIFFSLGTISSGDWTMMKRLVDILATDPNDKRLYVVSKGINGEKYQLNNRNMIGDKYVPQTVILEQADLAIVHGGNNSITECLHFGIPMIVLPVLGDQFDNAQRVEDLKLSKRLNVMKCTKEELLSAVDELLADSQLRERLAVISKGVQTKYSSRTVARMLNRILEKGQLEDRHLADYWHQTSSND